MNDPRHPALVVTGGNLLFDQEQLPPEGAEAAKVAADGVLRANQMMGAVFAGIGARDLAAGLPFLTTYHRPPTFSWLSLNLVDSASNTPLFTPILHQQVGGVTIAILALTDENALAPGSDAARILDWRAALPAALSQVEQQADVILLLSNYPFTVNQEIARTHPTIDLILQAGHAIGNMTPTPVNNALIAQTETRGRYVGVLDINWQGRGRWSEGRPSARDLAKQPASTYANRFIALKQSLASDPEIDALVKQTQRRLDSMHSGHTP